jgi:hypothetical protein
MKYQDLPSYPNFLLIAGTGRNVGKTTLVCQIIQDLSKRMNITALKISSHLHPVEEGQKVVVENAHYRIVEESLDSEKDSSRMKKAGAQVSYYIQCQKDHLAEALASLPFDIKNTAVVCESGGLHHVIKPGLFFLVEGDTIPENKKAAYQFNPIRVQLKNGHFNLRLQNIGYANKRFTYTIK